MGLIEAALAYAKKGRPVFPCHWATKAPLVEHGFKDASLDPDTVRAWWIRWPQAMIGMPTGPASGVWVLDVDDPDTFNRNCPIALPQTRRAETGKGFHLYWQWTGEVRSRARLQKDSGPWPYPDLPGAETRGAGGYIIVPPSIHPSGRVYRWSCFGQPVAAPSELLRIVQQATMRRNRPVAPAAITASGSDTRYGLAALEGECARIRTAPDGSQESTLSYASFRMGSLVAQGKLSSATARDRLISAGRAMPSFNNCDPWTAEIVAAKVAARLHAGMEASR